SSREVHAKALAPDGYGAILRQINVGRQFIVLVADIALERSKFPEPGLLHSVTVARVISGDNINVNIGTIRGFEVGEAENAFAIRELVNSGSTLAFVGDAMECSRNQNRFGPVVG